MNFVIMGPPGSGKDTQITELMKYMELQLISSGDIARKLAQKDEVARKIMDEGGLLDDKALLEEICQELEGIPRDTGVVFDGYPRTLHQADLLNEELLHHNRTLDKVIYIELEEGAIVDRLSRRRVCSICGHNVLKGSDKCADCGGRPIRREDDEPAVIIRRVQTFLENTLPLVQYYRNKGIMLETDGNKSISAVARDIKERLGYDSK